MNGRAWEKNFYTHVAFLILLRIFFFNFDGQNFNKRGGGKFWDYKTIHRFKICAHVWKCQNQIFVSEVLKFVSKLIKIVAQNKTIRRQNKNNYVFTKFRHQKSNIGHKYKNRSPNYNSDLKIVFSIKFYPCIVKISSSNSFFISPTNF